MSQEVPAWHDPGYIAVLELVAARAGLLPPSCPPAAMEGIQRAMARAGLTGDFSAYVTRLETDAAALDDLLVELTIGETYFFRNPEHFQFLRQTVLPHLERQRGPDHLLRAWSAGCSSGEEPYSLALLLQQEGYGGRMRVWGTDVSRAALARARAGSYGDWSLRGPEADRIRAYLHPDGQRRYTLAPEVRGRVRFDYLNLAEDTWPSRALGIWGMDIIFCRNVLIYFNRPTIEAVAQRFHDTLAQGGYLIVGPSDPALNGLAPFETLVTDWGIAYHRPVHGGTDLHAPPRYVSVHPPAPVPSPEPLPPLPAPAPSPAPPERPLPPLPPEPPASSGGLEEARRALGRGDWREAVRLATALTDDPDAAAMAVRAQANLDVTAAVRLCAEAAARHPLAVELRYLEATLLLGLGRLPEAERATRQALYLEPSLAVAYLTLGHLLRRQGQTEAAARAFGTAETLCASLPAEAPVPLADGERAARLARVAREERLRLEASEEER